MVTQHHTTMAKKIPNKTKKIEVRVTEEEYNRIKFISQKFNGGISQYVMNALAEFSDTNVKERMDAVKELCNLFVKFRDELSHLGSNINQIARHLNQMGFEENMEPIKARAFVEISPTLTLCQNFLTDIFHDVYDLTEKVSKIKYPRKIK